MQNSHGVATQWKMAGFPYQTWFLTTEAGQAHTKEASGSLSSCAPLAHRGKSAAVRRSVSAVVLAVASFSLAYLIVQCYIGLSRNLESAAGGSSSLRSAGLGLRRLAQRAELLPCLADAISTPLSQRKSLETVALGLMDRMIDVCRLGEAWGVAVAMMRSKRQDAPERVQRRLEIVLQAPALGAIESTRQQADELETLVETARCLVEALPHIKLDTCESLRQQFRVKSTFMIHYVNHMASRLSMRSWTHKGEEWNLEKTRCWESHGRAVEAVKEINRFAWSAGRAASEAAVPSAGLLDTRNMLVKATTRLQQWIHDHARIQADTDSHALAASTAVVARGGEWLGGAAHLQDVLYHQVFTAAFNLVGEACTMVKHLRSRGDVKRETINTLTICLRRAASLMRSVPASSWRADVAANQIKKVFESMLRTAIDMYAPILNKTLDGTVWLKDAEAAATEFLGSFQSEKQQSELPRDIMAPDVAVRQADLLKEIQKKIHNVYDHVTTTTKTLRKHIDEVVAYAVTGQGTPLLVAADAAAPESPPTGAATDTAAPAAAAAADVWNEEVAATDDALDGARPGTIPYIAVDDKTATDATLAEANSSAAAVAAAGATAISVAVAAIDDNDNDHTPAPPAAESLLTNVPSMPLDAENVSVWPRKHRKYDMPPRFRALLGRRASDLELLMAAEELEEAQASSDVGTAQREKTSKIARQQQPQPPAALQQYSPASGSMGTGKGAPASAAGVPVAWVHVPPTASAAAHPYGPDAQPSSELDKRVVPPKGPGEPATTSYAAGRVNVETLLYHIDATGRPCGAPEGRGPNATVGLPGAVLYSVPNGAAFQREVLHPNPAAAAAASARGAETTKGVAACQIHPVRNSSSGLLPDSRQQQLLPAVAPFFPECKVLVRLPSQDSSSSTGRNVHIQHISQLAAPQRSHVFVPEQSLLGPSSGSRLDSGCGLRFAAPVQVGRYIPCQGVPPQQWQDQGLARVCILCASSSSSSKCAAGAPPAALLACAPKQKGPGIDRFGGLVAGTSRDSDSSNSSRLPERSTVLPPMYLQQGQNYGWVPTEGQRQPEPRDEDDVLQVLADRLQEYSPFGPDEYTNYGY